jgi:hypothetical protein
MLLLVLALVTASSPHLFRFASFFLLFFLLFFFYLYFKRLGRTHLFSLLVSLAQRIWGSFATGL